MARTEKTAADKKDRAKDRRLRKKFGISLEEHNLRRANQRDRCAICAGPLDAYGPAHTDHFHFKVKAFRATQPCPKDLKWYAQAYDERGRVVFLQRAGTKEQAVKAVRTVAMPWSIRGLLCFKCNKGLGSIERFFDAASHPENLLPVIEYLKNRLTSQ